MFKKFEYFCTALVFQNTRLLFSACANENEFLQMKVVEHIFHALQLWELLWHVFDL